MSDLIDRQAAIEVIDAVLPVDPMKTEYAQGIACGAALAKTYVEQLPPAQPERPKGKWNTYYHSDIDFSYSCNQCGYSAPYQMIGGKVFQKKWNFCPNCGAKMTEESDGTT